MQTVKLIRPAPLQCIAALYSNHNTVKHWQHSGDMSAMIALSSPLDRPLTQLGSDTLLAFFSWPVLRSRCPPQSLVMAPGPGTCCGHPRSQVTLTRSPFTPIIAISRSQSHLSLKWHIAPHASHFPLATCWQPQVSQRHRAGSEWGLSFTSGAAQTQMSHKHNCTVRRQTHAFMLWGKKNTTTVKTIATGSSTVGSKLMAEPLFPTTREINWLS